MSTQTKQKFPVGTEVRHLAHIDMSKMCPDGRDDNDTARILNYCPDIADGAVFLDRDLHGSRYWNTGELEATGC